MDLHCRTWCARLESVRGPGIRVIAQAPADVSPSVLAAFAAAAVPLGYVTVDAQVDLPERERRAFWHRHVVLIHRGAPTHVSLRWIRELAQASPRAHAVVAIAVQPDRVHEGSAHLLHVLDPLPEAARDHRGQRANRLRQRHRLAAARRWTSASLEHACRVTDEIGAAQAFAHLNVSVEEAGAAASALVTRGRRLLSSLDQLSARSHVVAELADLWINQGEFEAATSALSGVEVECSLAGAEVPAWIRVRQCEVACWLGRWDEADRCARESAHPGWRAVVAFGRRDWDMVRVAASAAGEGHAEWHALLAVMSSAVADDRLGVIEGVAAVLACQGPARWRDALALESLHMVGADEAERQWKHVVGCRVRQPAEDALWRWVAREAAGSDPTQRDAPEEAVRRLGAVGIRRWGIGRHTMQVWAGVLSLLQQVHEADDAASALRQACRWAREYTGLESVAIVSHDGVVVIACDPAERRSSVARAGGGDHLDGERLVEPVRYGGSRIGDVVLQGEPRNAAEARAVAMALATACAPALRARLDDLQVSGAGEALAGELLGDSPAMRALRDSVARAAGSNFSVLIEGESGTGKELVARALHRLSPRRDRRWTAINCAALTDELLEAELFGHTRGAFTGAMGPRVGLLEDAHEGTLFLDEVAELSPRAQAKLLRVLQEGEIRRVGENVSRRVDVRLVTATNRPLAELARQDAYRQDLVFRLAVIRLRVPPLRDRIEDVPMLAQSFWRAAAVRAATRALLAPDAVAALCRAAWPGNVRELQNVIAALAVGGPTRGRISARHVSAVLADRMSDVPVAPPMSLATARVLSDRRVITSSLARHAGQQAATARELGISRQGLAKLIARLQVSQATGGQRV